MKSNSSGFTAVELMIVVTILIILSGVLSKLWYGMAKLEKNSAQRASITMKAQDLINFISKEVKQSIEVSFNEETQELRLLQIITKGSLRNIRIYRDGNEIVRQVQIEDQSPQTVKLADIDEDLFHIRLINENILEITAEVPVKDKTLSRYEREYKTVVYMSGGVQ